MRFTTIILVAVCLIALVNSLPLAENGALQSQALDRLVMVESDNDATQRSKRTIGILRQLFPQISEMIETKVNKIVGEVIKVLGPTVLRGVLNGPALGGGGGGGGGNKPKIADDGVVTAASPFDDEELEDDEPPMNSIDDIGSGSTNKTGNDNQPGKNTASSKSTSTTTSTTTTLASQSQNRENQEQEESNNEAAGSENNEVRVAFADQGTAANEADAELAPLEDTEASDDENRNKRFLNFGLGGNNGGTSGGSGGGSGNFLFDIIRQAADGAARAAGTVYRVVAGTQSLGLGLSASRDLGPSPSFSSTGLPAVAAAAPAPAAPATGTGTQPSLVAGSGSSGSNGGADPSVAKQDPALEAVPGPVTRLLVIANRGISNLLQDLILRLAATSERIVNFKARLITSII